MVAVPVVLLLALASVGGLGMGKMRMTVYSTDMS